MNMGKMGKACMLTFSALNWAQFQPFATCFHMFSPLQHVSDLSPDVGYVGLAWGGWPMGQKGGLSDWESWYHQTSGRVQQGPTGSNISGASVAGPRRKQHQPPLHQRVEGQLNDSKDFRVSLGEKMKNVESFGMTSCVTRCFSADFARTLFQFMPSMSPPTRTLLRRVSASPWQKSRRHRVLPPLRRIDNWPNVCRWRQISTSQTPNSLRKLCRHGNWQFSLMTVHDVSEAEYITDVFITDVFAMFLCRLVCCALGSFTSPHYITLPLILKCAFGRFLKLFLFQSPTSARRLSSFTRLGPGPNKWFCRFARDPETAFGTASEGTRLLWICCSCFEKRTDFMVSIWVTSFGKTFRNRRDCFSWN